MKKKPKKKKASLILFIAELIVLVVLVAAIFGYAKINEGLRNIGTAGGSGANAVTGTGNVAAVQTDQTAAVPEGTGQTADATAQTAYAETAQQTAVEAVAPDAAAPAEQPAAPEPEVVRQETGAKTLSGETVTHVGTDADPNADADAAEENAGVSTNQTMKGYTNIALVGIDTRDVNQIDYANSDTMIIASINNDTGKIRMVSVYRDTLLNIQDSFSMSLSQGDSDEVVTGEGDFDEGDVIFYDEGGEDEGGYDGGVEDVTAYDDGGGYDEGNDGGGEDGGDVEYYNEDDYSSYSESSSPSSSNSSTSSSYPASSSSSYVDADPDAAWSDYTSSTSSSSYSTVSEGAWSDYVSSDVTPVSENTMSEVFSEPDSGVSEYADREFYNYSETGTVENHQLGETTAAGRYDKANAAYANGSTKQLLQMLNKNMDLNIHDIVVVDFAAVAKLVDDIGGIDVWMTYQEVVHMNNYCQETSKVTGLSYTPIEPETMPREYHLNGVQAVSYARIRKTAGNDMKRTQRQRVVIQKVVNRAKQRGLDTVQAMINDVLPMCKTSFSPAEIIKFATQAFGFTIEKTTGFPFEHIEKDVYVGTRRLDAVVPVTLEQNVKELHEFLFDDTNYECSATVKEYSNDISVLSGLTEASREVAIKNSVIGQSGGEADVVD